MVEEEREGRTLADDRAERRRPYWLLIKPENMIFAAAEVVNTPDGTKEVLTHVRIAEEITEQVGFAEVIKKRIRILEPGLFEVWEFQEDANSKDEEWKIIESGFTGIDFIPIVTFYSDRQGLMLSKPPLEDLAHLNIRHWQSTADQINVLTVARFPIMAVAGAHDQGGSTMAIGPRQLMGTRDPNGRFYYVEHTGKSIEAGEKDLLTLEEQMSSYGSEFLRRKPSKPGNPETATGRALDSAEATSPLQDMVVRFIDSVNTALKITAIWLNMDEGGTVTITTDFGPEKVEAPDIEGLLQMRKNRDISRVAVIEEAKRRGLLAEDFNEEEDLTQLLGEVDSLKTIRPLIPGTFDPEEGDSSEKEEDKKEEDKKEEDKEEDK